MKFRKISSSYYRYLIDKLSILKLWFKALKYEDLNKIREKSENRFLEKNIIITYLISELSIMCRNMFRTTVIWRFEKCEKFLSKNKQKIKFLNFGASELRSRSKKNSGVWHVIYRFGRKRCQKKRKNMDYKVVNIWTINFCESFFKNI